MAATHRGQLVGCVCGLQMGVQSVEQRAQALRFEPLLLRLHPLRPGRCLGFDGMGGSVEVIAYVEEVHQVAAWLPKCSLI